MRQIFQNKCRNFPENGNKQGPEFSPLPSSSGSSKQQEQQNVLIAKCIYLVTVHTINVCFKKTDTLFIGVNL